MRIRFLFGLVSFLLIAGVVRAQALDESLEVAREINKQAVRSQQKIDQAAEASRKMLDEYRQLMLDTDYFQAQKKHLIQSLQQQEDRKLSLLHQLDQIQTTEKRLTPLLGSMVQALEKFVVLDLPFHHQQRIDSVLLLRERVQNVSLPLADRFQLVLEAFQIELEYGNTMEAYREQIEWQGEQLRVQCLRVGRTALYFLTPDAETAGYWHRASRQWRPLPQEYTRALRDGIRVAQGQLAPKLLPLPVANVESE